MPELGAITDTYVLQTKLENFGLSDGDGDLLIGLDAGDELIEVCFMLMTATAAERIQDLVLQGLNDIGDDATALAEAQAALVVPVAIDPSDFEPAGAVAAHTGDAVDAHDASAISNVPAGSIAATDVQAALNELDSEKAAVAHTHAASAITNTPAGGIAAVTVQAAIDELDSEKQPLDGTLTALAGMTIAADSLSIGTGADAFTQTTFAANTFPAKASTGSLVAKSITDFGLSFVDDANAAAGRTTLGLGTAATMASTAFDASGAADDAIVAHVAVSDPHTQYQKESEKDAANGYAGLDASARLVAARMPALTGDVTTTAGAVATTIASAAVTLAKMANLAQDAFIIRTTASTGVPETATCTAAARTVLDDASVSAMVDTLGGASSTGSGGLVRATSPTLVTPLLGTPTSGVLTNCTGTAAGLTAGNVTTNANLTGPVTSVGNATTIADVELAAIAGLTSAADKVPYFTGSGTAAVTDYTATARVVDAATSVDNLRQRIGLWRIFEDFYLGLPASHWATAVGGAGTANTVLAGNHSWMQVSDTQGLVGANNQGTSGSTSGGVIYGGEKGLYLADGSEFCFRIGTTHSTTALFRFGLRDDAAAFGADVVNGAYFELETGTSANWYGCTAAASARTKTTTGYAASNSTTAWIWFKIKFISTASGVTFSHWTGSAWTDDLTVTGTIPAAAGTTRNVRAFIQCIGNGATFRGIFMDAFGVPVPSAPPNWV